jgi:hypothetical protein
MKPLHLVLLLLLSALVGRSEIVLQGILRISGAVQLNLVDLHSTRSEWLTIGDEYHGWMLASFDTAGEVLMIQRDGEQRFLHIQQSGVIDYDREEIVLGMQISKPALGEHDFFVRIAGNQRCFFDDRLIDYATLYTRLKEMVASGSECRLRLHVVGDQNAEFAQRILEDAQRLPVSHTSIIFSRTDSLKPLKQKANKSVVVEHHSTLGK